MKLRNRPGDEGPNRYLQNWLYRPSGLDVGNDLAARHFNGPPLRTIPLAEIRRGRSVHGGTNARNDNNRNE
jgi:hypothetical protein